MRIEQLKQAPYNPRAIDDAALRGLGRSLQEFGDIAGIVWNKRTGHLVAGHQRLDALKREHGEQLSLKPAGKDRFAIVTPSGDRFPVRVVDWSLEQEKAANVAANNPHIAGVFDRDALGRTRRYANTTWPDRDLRETRS